MDIKNLSLKELREIAKEKDIKGRWSMNKEQLFKAIYSEEIAEEENKKYYKHLEFAKTGTIIVYKKNNDDSKYFSARIHAKSAIKKEFLCVDYEKDLVVVPYDDVVWVKTSDRMPNGIYRKLRSDYKPS